MPENFDDEEVQPPSFKPQHITILYNRVGKKTEGLPVDQIPDNDTLTTALHVQNGLTKLGYEAELFEVSLSTINQLPNLKTDLFFNSCFGVGSLPKTEFQIPKTLDEYQKFYTGGDAQNIILTTDKFLTKDLLAQNSLPTPKSKLFEHPGEALPRYLKFPLIVKPNQQDASLGISNKSVVTNHYELNKRIAHINKWYKEPALVEEFIDGRELNVAILGNGGNLTVLPVSEITFGSSFNKAGGGKKWRVITFAAKWYQHTKVYKETPGICPAPLPKDKEAEIRKLAQRAFEVTNCRDYARIDLRMRNDGSIYILEVNTNPSIDNEPDVGLIRSAAALGLDYPSLLQEIVSSAWKRYCPDFVNKEKEIKTPAAMPYYSNSLKTEFN